jgi:hypothetical protein
MKYSAKREQQKIKKSAFQMHFYEAQTIKKRRTVKILIHFKGIKIFIRNY